MRRLLLLASVILFAFWVLTVVADASGSDNWAAPLRIAPGPEVDRDPVVAAGPDGRIVVAWKRLSVDLDAAALYIAQSPDWTGSPVSSLPPADLKRIALSMSVDDGVRLAWSLPSTGTQTIWLRTLWTGEESPRIWKQAVGHPWAFAVDGEGHLHSVWAQGNRIHYTSDAQNRATTIEIDPATAVSELSLALGKEGAAHLAWTGMGQLGEGSGLYYAPLVAGATPIVIAPEASMPRMRVGPSGLVHLCWQRAGWLYYANGEDWTRSHVVERDFPNSGAFALAVGSGEVAHLAWTTGRALWHASSVDWHASRTQVTASSGATSLRMVVDDRGVAHIVWAAPEGEDNWDIYYLRPTPVSPQLQVTYPRGGEVLSGDSQAQAVSNVRESELLRVEFYLQVEDRSSGSLGGALLSLGLDKDGRDGWSVPLPLTGLVSAMRYRLVALGTDVQGTIIHASGDWFTVQRDEVPWVWLQPSGPDPTRGAASVNALIHDAYAPPRRLDLFFSPVREGACDAGLRWAGSSLSQSYYIGSYEVPWRREFVFARWHQLAYDSRLVPDGHYTARAIATDRVGRRTYSSCTRAFTVDNTMCPKVEVISPKSGVAVKDLFPVLARANDADGVVERVDFYLEHGQPLLPASRLGGENKRNMPRLFWLGSDTDGSDGWSRRARIGDFWEGEWWRAWAVAFDDQGFSSSAHSAGVFTMHGPDRPHLAIVAPWPNKVLQGVEAVRLLVTRGSDRLDRVQAYVGDVAGALADLGEMTESEGIWVCDWDTRSYPDGAYFVLAVGHEADGRRSLDHSDWLRVNNSRASYAFEAPLPNETLTGPSLIRLRGSPALPRIDEVRFYVRDDGGELHFIGQDTTSENGWATIWNTADVLDGQYELIAFVADSDGRTSRIDREIVVGNVTPSITLERFPTARSWRGFQRIFWRAQHPAGEPMSVTVEYGPDGGTHWMELASGIPAGESFLWDTKAYPDSPQAYLRLTVTDGMHSADTTSQAFAVSNVNEPPHVTLLSPKPDQAYGRRMRIAWRAWDPDGDVMTIGLDYRRADSFWRPIAHDLTGSSSYEWDTGSLPRAEDYEVRISARDPLGATGTDLVEGISFVANNAPRVRLLWPNTKVRLEGETAILWQATDQDNDRLLIDLYYSDSAGQTWLPVAEGLPNTGYYAWQVSYLPVGAQYRVRVVARDEVLQAADESDDVFSVGQNAQPQVAFLSPAAGTLSGTQLVTWLAFDPDGSPLDVSLVMRPSGQLNWQPLASDLADDGFYLWDTTRHPDGEYDLGIKVSDGRSSGWGTLSGAISVVNRRNRPPHVELTSPRGGELWTGIREVTWEAWDPDGDAVTAALHVSADGGKSWDRLGSLDARAGHYIWDTSRSPSGENYLVRAVVSDGFASASDTSPGVFYLTNRQSYPPHVLITSPDASGRLLRRDTVTWIAEDVDGDPLTVRLSVSEDGGLTWREVAHGLSNTGEHFLGASLRSGCTYQVRVCVSDGIYRVQAISVPFDWGGPEGQLPTLAIEAPRGGERWSGTRIIRWRATDPLGETLRVHIDLSRDGGQSWEGLARNLQDTGSYEWDTTRSANGPCSLRLTADNGRATSRRRSVTVLLDNHGRNAPVISIVRPRGGEVWSGPQEIRWGAWDADGDPLTVRLAYSIDRGHTWHVLAHSLADAGSYIWDTTAVPNAEEMWLRASVSDGQFASRAAGAGPFVVRNRHIPVVRLLTPKGGERWAGKQEISWCTAQGPGTIQVSLEMSLDGGKMWQIIASGLPSQGSYLWDTATVPGESLLWIRAVAARHGQSAYHTLWEPIVVCGNPALPRLPFFLR